MIWIQIFGSIFLLFIGVYSIVGAFRLDSKSQKKLSKDPYTSIFIIMPLWLAKIVLFLLGLFPIIIIVAMWLQEFGVIE